MGAIGLQPAPRGPADGVRRRLAARLRRRAVAVRGDRPPRRRRSRTSASGGRTGFLRRRAARSRRCSPRSSCGGRARWLALAGIAGTLAIISMYVYSRTNGVARRPARGRARAARRVRHHHDGRRARARRRPRAHARPGGRGGRRCGSCSRGGGRCGRARRPGSWCEHGARHPPGRARAAPGRRAGPAVDRWPACCSLSRLLLGCRLLVAEPFSIPSASMSPTLEAGDHVIANKLAYRFGAPKAGRSRRARGARTASCSSSGSSRSAASASRSATACSSSTAVPGASPTSTTSRVDGFFFGPARVPDGRGLRARATTAATRRTRATSARSRAST